MGLFPSPDDDHALVFADRKQYRSAMKPGDFGYHRLSNQRIACSPCKTPKDVISTLGALQAQDYLGALWAIGLRIPGSTEADIQEAINNRSIVRTWPMRGTLHFVAAEDVRWMLNLLTPRVIAGSARRQQQLELDHTVFARSRDVLTRVLLGGNQLTRDEVRARLEAAGISTAGQRGYHILWRLAQEGLLCFAAHAGKQPTFALLDEWAPCRKSIDRDEALATLTLRYFTSHGPATLQDFTWWSGLKVTEAKAGLAMVSAQLEVRSIDGRNYWMPQNVHCEAKGPASLFLLPGFDEYLLGYTDRRDVLDATHAQKVVPGNNGMFMPTVVSGGRVIGTWKRTLRKERVVLTTHPFDSFKKADSAAYEVAAEHYGRFLGKSVVFEHPACA